MYVYARIDRLGYFGGDTVYQKVRVKRGSSEQEQLDAAKKTVRFRRWFDAGWPVRVKII